MDAGGRGCPSARQTRTRRRVEKLRCSAPEPWDAAGGVWTATVDGAKPSAAARTNACAGACEEAERRRRFPLLRAGVAVGVAAGGWSWPELAVEPQLQVELLGRVTCAAVPGGVRVGCGVREYLRLVRGACACAVLAARVRPLLSIIAMALDLQHRLFSEFRRR